MMPMRPAAEAPIWMLLLAAPVCEDDAADPDAVEEEEEPEPEVAASNHVSSRASCKKFNREDSLPLDEEPEPV